VIDHHIVDACEQLSITKRLRTSFDPYWIVIVTCIGRY